MRYCQQQMAYGVTEEWVQTVVVATTLAAGWIQSPERVGLG
jgi:hypothetical protein